MFQIEFFWELTNPILTGSSRVCRPKLPLSHESLIPAKKMVLAGWGSPYLSALNCMS